MGTEGGLFGTGVGAVDFTPVGSGLDALEAIEKKRWQDILPLLLIPPAFRKGAVVGKHLTKEAVEYLEGLFGREARQAEKTILPMVDEAGGAGGKAGKQYDELFLKHPLPKGVSHVGVGPNGPILEGFQDRWPEMLDWMQRAQTGEALGVLYHPGVGRIDVFWGDEGKGLKHILNKHKKDIPKLPDLPKRLAEMKVWKERSIPGWKIVLSSGIRGRGGWRAVARLDWDGKRQNWLLTAFEEKPLPRGLSVPRP